MTQSRWLPLGLFLFLALLTGLIGALATATSVHTWYPTLIKPAWTAPNWLFAPVWTLLYIAMAVATWRVWSGESPVESRRTFRLYSAQLGLNALWSILFFALHHPGWALIDILALWLILIRVLARYRALDRVAAWLWTAYLLWVTYAVLLNASIWDSNH